jgi:hypothetical protein
MDEFERFMSRAGALWRSKQTGKKTSLWGFENWGSEGTQEHHVGRRKYSNILTTIPLSMHPELTRRQLEEHPPEGPDPDNPLERRGRVHLDVSDMHEGLADGHRLVGTRMIEAAARGERDLSAVDVPEGLLGWLDRIAHDLAAVAKRAMKDLDV